MNIHHWQLHPPILKNLGYKHSSLRRLSILLRLRQLCREASPPSSPSPFPPLYPPPSPPSSPSRLLPRLLPQAERRSWVPLLLSVDSAPSSLPFISCSEPTERQSRGLERNHSLAPPPLARLALHPLSPPSSSPPQSSFRTSSGGNSVGSKNHQVDPEPEVFPGQHREEEDLPPSGTKQLRCRGNEISSGSTEFNRFLTKRSRTSWSKTRWGRTKRYRTRWSRTRQSRSRRCKTKRYRTGRSRTSWSRT